MEKKKWAAVISGIIIVLIVIIVVLVRGGMDYTIAARGNLNARRVTIINSVDEYQEFKEMLTQNNPQHRWFWIDDIPIQGELICITERGYYLYRRDFCTREQFRRIYRIILFK